VQTQNNQPPAPTVVPTNEARQGVTGHNVRYVLGFGIVGVVIGFVLTGLFAVHQFYGALW
jgi:hypothetical protein